MTLMKKYLLILAVIVASLPLGGCKPSFTLNGAPIDYNLYHTIHVSDFPIRAALVYPPLQQTFENELLNYITRNTRLQTIDGPSDLTMEGEITQYYLTPQAVTEDAYASRTRLTIGVRVKYTDARAEERISTRPSPPIATSTARRCSPTCRISSVRRLPKNLCN